MTGLELRLGRVPCGRVAEAPVLLPAGRTRSLVIGAPFALNAEGSMTADLCVCVWGGVLLLHVYSCVCLHECFCAYMCFFVHLNILSIINISDLLSELLCHVSLAANDRSLIAL